MNDPLTGLDFSQVEESIAVEGLRFIINSPAWKDFFMPELERACAESYLMLKVEPDQRKPVVSDALLRARIWVLEKVMKLGPDVIRDYDEMRMKREQQEAIAEGYAERAADGRMGPPA